MKYATTNLAKLKLASSILVEVKNNLLLEMIDFTGVQRNQLLHVNKSVKNKFGELKKIHSSLQRKKTTIMQRNNLHIELKSCFSPIGFDTVFGANYSGA